MNVAQQQLAATDQANQLGCKFACRMLLSTPTVTM